MATITKAKEIEILKSLIGDTYFDDYFSTEDIETMCYNIKNDLPLGLDCMFTKKADIAEKKLSDERKTAKQKMLDLAEKMITEEYADGNSFRFLEDEVGLDAIIKIKHKNNIPLNNAELDYLVSKLG